MSDCKDCRNGNMSVSYNIYNQTICSNICSAVCRTDGSSGMICTATCKSECDGGSEYRELVQRLQPYHII